MIYILEVKQGPDDGQVVSVYEAEEGTPLHFVAFLESMGLRHYPVWDAEAARVNANYAMEWAEEVRRWHDERDALLAAKGITDRQAAHREWLEAHPAVKSVPFEEI